MAQKQLIETIRVKRQVQTCLFLYRFIYVGDGLVVKRINIEELKEELKDKKIRLHLGTKESILYGDPVTTPIHYKMQFDNILVKETFPPTILLKCDSGTVEISRIKEIYRDCGELTKTYLIWCGNKEKELQSLVVLEVL